MLTFLLAEHRIENPSAGQTGIRLERSERAVSPWPRLLGTADFHNSDRLHDESWNCTSLLDFRFLGNAVRQKPLQAWERAKRLGAQGALLGAGAGVLVGVGLGVLCWPLALGGLALGGRTAGGVQYDALEKAELLDESILFLSEVACEAMGPPVRALDALSARLGALQALLKERKAKYAAVAKVYEPMASALHDLLERGKTDPNVTIDWRFYS